MDETAGPSGFPRYRTQRGRNLFHAFIFYRHPGAGRDPDRPLHLDADFHRHDEKEKKPKLIPSKYPAGLSDVLAGYRGRHK